MALDGSKIRLRRSRSKPLSREGATSGETSRRLRSYLLLRHCAVVPLRCRLSHAAADAPEDSRATCCRMASFRLRTAVAAPNSFVGYYDYPQSRKAGVMGLTPGVLEQESGLPFSIIRAKFWPVAEFQLTLPSAGTLIARQLQSCLELHRGNETQWRQSADLRGTASPSFEMLRCLQSSGNQSPSQSKPDVDKMTRFFARIWRCHGKVRILTIRNRLAVLADFCSSG